MGRTIKYALGGALFCLAIGAAGMALGYAIFLLPGWGKAAAVFVIVAGIGAALGISAQPQQKGTD